MPHWCSRIVYRALIALPSCCGRMLPAFLKMPPGTERFYMKPNEKLSSQNAPNSVFLCVHALCSHYGCVVSLLWKKRQTQSECDMSKIVHLKHTPMCTHTHAGIVRRNKRPITKHPLCLLPHFLHLPTGATTR